KPDDAKGLDLSEYRTVENAITSRVSRTIEAAVEHPGFLGIHVTSDSPGKVMVAEVAADSPAARAGVKKGDLLSKLNGKEVTNADQVRDILQGKSAGESVKLAVQRDATTRELTATLAPISRPMKPGPQRPFLGLVVESRKDADGVVIKDV